MSIEQSTLTAFMDAVTEYYGGADIWAGITDAGAFTSAEFAAKVTQVDGVTAMYNSAGDVLYYKYNDQIVANSVDLSNVINSNTGSTIASNSVNIPANTTVSQGTAAASSGMKTASATTAKTVIKDVALGVAAVGAGIQLGAAIDSALYNLNPDFWDENNMSALNPQTWDSLVSDYGEPAEKVFNMVFGINSNNQVQPYLDERVVAYIAQYMVARGVFGNGDETAEPSTEQGLIISQTDLDRINIPIPISNTAHITQDTGRYLIENEFTATGSDPVYFYIDSFSNNSLRACSLGQFTINKNTTEYDRNTGTTTQYSNTYASTQISGGYLKPQGAGDYYIGTGGSYSNVTNITPSSATKAASASNASITDIILFGVIQSSGVEGITTQDGAIIPTGITPQMSIDDVIAQLQILYPDLFTNKLTNDVIQPDGTVITYTYIPVSIPENVPLDDVSNALRPTGGTEFTQGQTSIDPTVTPDDLIDTLLKLITSTDPYSPTQTPTDTPTEYPDTGDGTTPPFVLPTGSASALYSVYNPTQAQLNSLGAWLWSSNFVDQLLKLFNDPMQAIIGLHKIFATPPTSGSGTIKVGYLDSGVGANLVSAQYTEVDCGTVSLQEYFGNVLDYTDTDIYLYLPFIGIVPVSTLDVVRSNINVKYKVDVLTGACMVQVYVNRDNNSGGQLYCYAGNCAVQYPLSSGSYMGIVASALGIAGSVAGTILSGGAMLPMALGVGASALGGARTKVERSGSLSGNSGAMGIKKPYLIIRRPQTKIADNFEFMAGANNNVYDVLSSFSGLTRVKYVHLENIPATSDELAEIETLLKSGVMI